MNRRKFLGNLAKLSLVPLAPKAISQGPKILESVIVTDPVSNNYANSMKETKEKAAFKVLWPGVDKWYGEKYGDTISWDSMSSSECMA